MCSCLFCGIIKPPVDQIANAQDAWEEKRRAEELEALKREASYHNNVELLFYVATAALWVAATVPVYGRVMNETSFVTPDGEPFSLSLWHLSFTSWIWILLWMGFSWYVYKSMNDHIGIFKLLDRWEQSIIQRKRELERRMTEQEKRAIRGVDSKRHAKGRIDIVLIFRPKVSEPRL